MQAGGDGRRVWEAVILTPKDHRLHRAAELGSVDPVMFRYCVPLAPRGGQIVESQLMRFLYN
jgi:hypothetical protein